MANLFYLLYICVFLSFILMGCNILSYRANLETTSANDDRSITNAVEYILDMFFIILSKQVAYYTSFINHH